MATITKGKTFVSGETVEPADMHQLVDQATVTFVTADDTDNSTLEVSSNKFRLKDAGTTVAKLAATLDLTGKTVTLPSGSVNAAALASNAVETAKINDAAVTAAKLNGVGKDINGTNLAVGTAPVFGVRAWVRFDGTRNVDDTGASVSGGLVKIYGAANVTSVTRTGSGAGRFTVTMTTAAPHTNYSAIANFNVADSDLRGDNGGGASCHTYTTTTVQVVCATDSGSEAAPKVVNVAIIY